ncbi:ParB/RepB/Spo0J family partition protein [Legionella pneumophila]|nr:ParB/RepB/Spo0J family partition protein [Legionella pneumophila]
MQTRFTYLPVTSLQAGQYQPRQDFNVTELQELAQSISSQGLIEPLVVRPIAKERYEIIAGERRWRAAKLAGLNEVPCLIGDYSDQQACALTLIENIQRQDLNLIEEATGYKRLIEEFHYHQDEIAALVGKSRSHVANILRLLTLTDKVKQLVRDKVLSFGHARVLVGLNPEQQEMFAQQIIGEEWSVRHLEQEIKSYKNKDINSPKNPRKDRDIERLQTILAEQVGLLYKL